MITHLRLLTLAALTLAVVPGAAGAQNAATKTIPPGSYSLVADSNFTGGVDVSGFTLRFEGDSILVAEQGGMTFIRSRLAYTSEELTWTDLEGQLSCPGVARYKYSVDARSGDVRLTPIEDSCPERSGVLAQVRLVRLS